MRVLPIIAVVLVQLLSAAAQARESDALALLKDEDFQLDGMSDDGCGISVPGETRETSKLFKRPEASLFCSFGWSPLFVRPAVQADLETYQIFWDRSFHSRIVLKVTRLSDGSGVFDAEVRPPKLDAELLVPLQKDRAVLTASEMDALAARVGSSPFWKEKTSDPRWKGGNYPQCTDGSLWIFEGVRQGHHRAFALHTCYGGTWLPDVTIALLLIAQKKFPFLPIDPVY